MYSKKIEDVVDGDKVYIHCVLDTYIGQVIYVSLDTIVVKENIFGDVYTINKNTNISEEDSLARFEFFSI